MFESTDVPHHVRALTLQRRVLMGLAVPFVALIGLVAFDLTSEGPARAEATLNMVDQRTHDETSAAWQRWNACVHRGIQNRLNGGWPIRERGVLNDLDACAVTVGNTNVRQALPDVQSRVKAVWERPIEDLDGAHPGRGH